MLGLIPYQSRGHSMSERTKNIILPFVCRAVLYLYEGLTSLGVWGDGFNCKTSTNFYVVESTFVIRQTQSWVYDLHRDSERNVEFLCWLCTNTDIWTCSCEWELFVKGYHRRRSTSWWKLLGGFHHRKKEKITGFWLMRTLRRLWVDRSFTFRGVSVRTEWWYCEICIFRTRVLAHDRSVLKFSSKGRPSLQIAKLGAKMTTADVSYKNVVLVLIRIE